MSKIITTSVIYGSTRPERLCDRIVEWTLAQIHKNDHFEPIIVDPAGLETTPESIQKNMAESDAFIIVTPEYNHGYTASLKALIDEHVQEWRAKPVSFVSYGGITGGILAVEQLRTVMACLNAVPLRDGVMFPHAWQQIDKNNMLQPPKAAEKAIAFMLKRLEWWALGLRDARHNRPFPVQHPKGL